MQDDASGVNNGSRPTHADVARLVGVSTATVSYVLNNAEGRRISPRTRDAVYRAAEQLGYRPNIAARTLARGTGGVVLYIVPRVAVGDLPIQAGSRMATELARRGLLQVQIFETEDDRHVVDAIESLDPSAVISIFPLSSDARDAADAAKVPYIEVGLLPALGDPLLSIGTMRVGHLVERGHRAIAFAQTGIAKWRTLGDYWLEGVIRAAESHRLPAVRAEEVTPDNVADVVTAWVDDGVTAVCAQSDEIACLVLHGIRQAGLRCPDDLAVIGIDADPLGALSSPPLTTVEFNPAAVADIAIAAVLARLGFSAPRLPETSELAHLVVRASA